jgi:hypothetical protein
MHSVLLIIPALAVVRAQLSLTVNADATYDISLGGRPWLSSAADAYVVTYAGQRHTTRDGTLVADSAPTPIAGHDVLGSYSGYSVAFNQGIFVASFRLYAARSALIFQQSFPKGLTGMNASDDVEDLATGFPAFGRAAQLNSTDTGFVAWSGDMSKGHPGLWNLTGSSAPLGSQSGPLALFDSTGATIVLSPASAFMTAQLALANACGTTLCAGHNGRVTTVPEGWTLETAAVGLGGINSSVMALGDLLLTRGGKTRTAANADVTISTLGWWTDNGTPWRIGRERGPACGLGGRGRQLRREFWC